MKVRNGFVSNSSSSSFVVKRADYNWSEGSTGYIFFLSKDEEEALEKEGFVRADCACPQQAYFEYWAEMNHMAEDKQARNEELASWNVSGLTKVVEEADEEGNKVSFIRNVTCNEIEVIEFLVEKNISFYADLHYESCSMLFTADKKNPEDGKITIASNFGKDMYFNQHKKPTEKSHVTVTAREFKKKDCNYHRFLEE